MQDSDIETCCSIENKMILKEKNNFQSLDVSQFTKKVGKEFVDAIVRYNLTPSLLKNEDINKHTFQGMHNAAFIREDTNTANKLKPLFITQIEQYIKREIELLELKPVTHPHPILETKQFHIDAQLQVYREAFHLLTKHLPTLRLILRQIKEAYESSLSVRDERIEEMDILKTSLLSLEATAEEKNAIIYRQGWEKVHHHAKERIHLLQVIDNLQFETDSKSKIIAKLKDELSIEHERLLNEIDSRRLLHYDLTNLRRQMDYTRQKISSKRTSETQNDPVVLQLMLTKCREDLRVALHNLNEVQTNYDDVLLQRDLQAAQKFNKDTHNENAELQNTIVKLQKEHITLKGEFHILQEKNKALQERVSGVHTSNTPQPD